MRIYSINFISIIEKYLSIILIFKKLDKIIDIMYLF